MAQLFSQPSPRWIGVAIAFYAFIAIGIAEGGLGVLLPSILQEYSLTPASVTLLFVSQITGYIFAAFTSSLISSWLGLARMLLMAAGTLTLALAIYATAPIWALMVAAGTLLGLGIGLIDAGVNTYIVQDERGASLIGTLHGFYGVGALSGPAIATTLLAMGVTWRQVYGVLTGVVGLLIVALLAVMVIRYPPMNLRGVVTSEGASAAQNLGRSLRHPAVLLTGLLLLVYVGTEAAIGNWAYTVQSVGRNMPAMAAGYGVAAYWLGLTVGRFGLDYCLRRVGAVRMISLSLTLLLIGLFAWWQLPDQWLSLPMIGLALAAIFPATIWLVPQRLPAELVPGGISFSTSAASFGAAIIPTSAGWIANATSLESIPVLMLPLAIAMILIHLWLVQHSPSDRSLS
ncbi:sugar MFS transporter [Thermoleptolyngbya sp. C42_A2020_037]|uniref:MFS transporter n=1 Tax=Thermoleptolyngbya sp. C42_A2020_037 TaxID=2747799 RepID=UPI0019FE91DA|nr:MFS transporter [Thermoleptolyngbya sp. C42_A2020_037]MBF2084950.1 MFS transporter [Thermoleptolyngbya sp. C42_A2020_037]